MGQTSVTLSMHLSINEHQGKLILGGTQGASMEGKDSNKVATDITFQYFPELEFSS